MNEYFIALIQNIHNNSCTISLLAFLFIIPLVISISFLADKLPNPKTVKTLTFIKNLCFFIILLSLFLTFFTVFVPSPKEYPQLYYKQESKE